MITNPDSKRILVFGDSLSWGYVPGSKHQRYPVNLRWPGRLQSLLGDGFEVIEECLNSRGIENGDARPGKEGRRALDYIEACLDSHDPLDQVLVLLGTNEMKHELNLSPKDICKSMEQLLTTIKSRPSQFRVTYPEVTLIAPPVIDETTPYCIEGNKYLGARYKSKALTEEYRQLAQNLNIEFIALQDIQPGIDGIHFDEGGHEIVAQLVRHSISSTSL